MTIPDTRPADPPDAERFVACPQCRYSSFHVKVNTETKVTRVLCSGCGAVLFESQGQG